MAGEGNADVIGAATGRQPASTICGPLTMMECPYSPPTRRNRHTYIAHFKRMTKKTGLHGATTSSFRDSFVRGVYENGYGWRDLMVVTGIKKNGL